MVGLSDPFVGLAQLRPIMDPGAPMILPKGIVINTTNIYKEVAGYSIIPADKIWEYWHGSFCRLKFGQAVWSQHDIDSARIYMLTRIPYIVYTVTNKKLRDPTARRLENFWWQVWGSDRRYLSGQALARLYEDISVGPTAVPLHGPPNRWEGPDVSAQASRYSPVRIFTNVAARFPL